MTTPVGMALNKRCDAWHLRLDKMSFEREGSPEAKTRALQDVSRSYAGQSGTLQAVAKARLQWLNSLQHQHGGHFGFLELVGESRLLLHLGRASVLENVGLYAERTTGLPIIPGTALKGVISTWACWTDHFNHADGSFREFTDESKQRRHFRAQESRLAQRILGDDNTGGSEHAGEVIFVGGFPTTPPKLGLDIVNPHYDSVGRDKTNLTPNAFLCVEPGTRWRFAFFVRPGVPDAAALLVQTKTWIEEALTQTGIGAKTAAGYGRFRQPNAEDAATQAKQTADANAAAAAEADRARTAALKAQRDDVARTMLRSDYPNEVSFKNRVLDKLNPGRLEQLQAEIPLLQKPQNENWQQQLKQTLASREFRDIRKRLRHKDWFPQDWLPSQ